MKYTHFCIFQDKRSFLTKLIGHVHGDSTKQQKRKYDPSEAKYLGEFKPDFKEITEEVNKAVKD